MTQVYKDVLRKKSRCWRKSLPWSETAEKNRAIFQHIRSHPAYVTCQNLFVYVSGPLEVDTCALVESAWSEGKQVAVPRCHKKKKGLMDFHPIMSWLDLQPGAMGIREPKGDTPPVYPDKSTLMVTPGLLFDRRGYRLGYGGGYYDRYLAGYPCLSMGLVYGAQLMNALPTEGGDMAVDIVITENEVWEPHQHKGGIDFGRV